MENWNEVVRKGAAASDRSVKVLLLLAKKHEFRGASWHPTFRDQVYIALVPCIWPIKPVIMWLLSRLIAEASVMSSSSSSNTESSKQETIFFKEEACGKKKGSDQMKGFLNAFIKFDSIIFWIL
ncbi:uncharacterized protein LOC116266063 isoform X2 [Nymphaea colorata]|uniref:uncharacterized protein LOC116266063 isoform X2 n=1 Tax=Nymphaea colorata TaxID=210225 RepID=UPI00129E0EA5|nr:uncharacterized protein LOC116266063 isoform X2 [Nymphaea colorata]